MSNKKTIGRNLTEHRRLWIIVLFFGRVECCLLFGASASIINAYVIEYQIFDVAAGNATDDRPVFRFGVIHDDVAECHATQRAHRWAGRSAHTAAKTQEDRTVGDVTHGDV